jgi:hypothetical protein
MGQLKTLKMQQVLKELEEAEDLQKAQEFYGEKSYQDWMKKKNLQDPRQKDAEKDRIFHNYAISIIILNFFCHNYLISD